MTVFRNKQRGNRWAYDFWAKGRRYRGYCVDPETGQDATSKSRAREIEGALKQAVRVQAKVARSAPRPGTFSLAEALLLHIEAQVGSSPAYVANLELYSRELLGYFGEGIPVAEVTQKHVDNYRAWCAEQPLKVWKGGALASRDRHDPRWWGVSKRARSPASANHYLKCLRAALAQAHRARDPLTGLPMLPFPPEVKPLPAAKRQPRPMPDAELKSRLAKAPPWVRDAAELARLFGLRRAEALAVKVGNIEPGGRALRFTGEEVKSGRDELAHASPGGRELLKRLAAQARARGVDHLVTWPGRAHWKAWLEGEKVPAGAWAPLKSIRRAWRTTAAGAAGAHRFHDVRARYVTEVAKVASSATTQEAARHQDAATTARYTAIAGAEVAKAVNRAVRANLTPLRAIGGGGRK